MKLYFLLFGLLAYTAQAQKSNLQITIQTADGQTVEIGRGKVTVICSWDIHTESVINEFPTLNDLVEKYSDKGVQFLALCQSKKEKVTAFLKEHPLHYAHLSGKEAKSLEKRLGNGGMVRRYPSHFVINAKGEQVESAVGSCDTVHSIIEKSLE